MWLLLLQPLIAFTGTYLENYPPFTRSYNILLNIFNKLVMYVQKCILFRSRDVSHLPKEGHEMQQTFEQVFLLDDTGGEESPNTTRTDQRYGLRPNKKIFLFPVSRPTVQKHADRKKFYQHFEKIKFFFLLPIACFHHYITRNHNLLEKF